MITHFMAAMGIIGILLWSSVLLVNLIKSATDREGSFFMTFLSILMLTTLILAFKFHA